MKEHELIIVGGGPGGYVAAIRAAQLGMDVACVDENDSLGGACLRVGCIPSKALLESSHLYAEAQHKFGDHGISVGDVVIDLNTMLKRKHRIVETLGRGVASLLKKNKISHYTGRAKLLGDGKLAVTGGDETTELQGKHILLAVGSQPFELPGAPFDGQNIGSSTDALSYDKVPESLVVIGGGYIGLEMGSVWNRLGSKVTILEALDRILPGSDADIAKAAQKIFVDQGFEFRLGARVSKATSVGDHCEIELEGGEKITASKVLVAIGRKPNTKNLGLDEAGVQVDQRGYIQVDENYQAAPGVYAIGDCIGGLQLAHKASDEGTCCVEKLAGKASHLNYDCIPAVAYTHPEIASVGKREDELQEAGIEYNVGKFQFRGSGRARTLGDVDGFVKVLADKKTDRILGVHILGPRAGDLIAEAVAAMEFGASSEDLAKCVHAHPTLAESVKEAAMAVPGLAIHQ